VDAARYLSTGKHTGRCYDLVVNHGREYQRVPVITENSLKEGMKFLEVVAGMPIHPEVFLNSPRLWKRISRRAKETRLSAWILSFPTRRRFFARGVLFRVMWLIPEENRYRNGYLF
jgi:hypothetical protein